MSHSSISSRYAPSFGAARPAGARFTGGVDKELYRPSGRDSAPISSGRVHRLASNTIFSEVGCPRLAFPPTPGTGIRAPIP